MSILRSILAVIVGLLAGSAVVAAIEMADFAIYQPPHLQNDPKEFARFIANAPTGMFLLLLLAYAAGTFTGALVAALIAARYRLAHGMIIGVLFLLAGIANLFSIEHPLWVAVMTVVVFLPSAYAGALLATAKRS